MAVKVLIIEDDRKILTMMSDYLTALDYEVDSSRDGLQGLNMARTGGYDLVLLDVMLPGMDGIDILRKLRESTDTPVIMVTAKGTEEDKLLGLDHGADDYIVKPFSMKELAARIRAVNRRSSHTNVASGNKLTQGPFYLDPAARVFSKNGKERNLTSAQFAIMRQFLSEPRRVFTRVEILTSFQEHAYEGYERSIDVHIKNLRKIVEEDSTRPGHIVTVWGVGYKFVPEGTA